MIGLVCMAYVDGRRHEFAFLPRLQPYPVQGAPALV